MERNIQKATDVPRSTVPEKNYKSPRLDQTIRRKREYCKREPGTEGTVNETLLISDELNQRIKNRGRNLRLRQADVQFATTLVNNLKKELLKFLKDNEEQPFFRDISVLSSGSYYELVKINKPNEFDIMLKLKTPRIMSTELKDHSGLFYTVQLCRPTRAEIRSFLLEDGLTISASKIMNEMHRLVCKFVATHKVSEGHWVVCSKRVNSPAVTLSFKTSKYNGEEILSLDIVPALEVPQGWPQAAKAGPVVDNWLGKNARRKFVGEPVYFVPKRPKMRNLSDIEKESWRISFSHIEKQMIRFHGNKKTCCEDKKNLCCRKLCLRLLKCLFEGLKQIYPKELKSLCSYHGKTAFFHNLAARFEDSLWAPDKLPICFMILLVEFEHAAQVGTLPHFFVPECNLFSPSRFPRRSLVFLSNALREQRESELPLLQVPGPVPALCSMSASPSQVQPQLICPKTITVTPEKTVKWFVAATIVILFVSCGLILYYKATVY